MKSLGIVNDMNHKGELLVKTSEAQRPGTWVFDRRKAKIGHVMKTIGPVASPYLIVKVSGIPEKERMHLLNSEVFSDKELESRNKKRGSRHGKKKRRSR